MDLAEITVLTSAVVRLVTVLIWPALIAYVLVRFSPELRDFMANLGQVSFSGGGFQATATRRNRAAAALAAASVSWPDKDTSPHATAAAARQAVRAVGDLSAAAIARTANARILWVDDEPDNNVNERQALEALGVRFVLSLTTANALSILAAQSFDAVISDMARDGDQRAGYALLDALVAAGNTTPVIIYASSRLPEHVAEAKAHGAFGCTNQATELFGLVLAAVDRN